MNVAQFKSLCARMPGAECREHGPPANILVYSVGGKRFAHFKTGDPERWRFSFKVASERFLELTDVPGIQPARWLARHHWITIVGVRSVPAAQLTEPGAQGGVDGQNAKVCPSAEAIVCVCGGP